MDRRPRNSTPPAPRASRQPCRFGPSVPAVARFLASTIEPADSVAFLVEINQRWPGLSFRDYLGACVLAAALVMKVEGNA
jgi:hypothetical protein